MAVALCASVALAAPATAPATQASRPASAPAHWGPDKAAVAVGIDIDQPVVFGQKLLVRVWLQNSGTAAVRLPATQPAGAEPFAWLFIVRHGPDGKSGFYSQKAPAIAHMKDWPAQLAGGTIIELPVVDSGRLAIMPYASGLKIENGYPKPLAATAPAGGPQTVGDCLAMDKLSLRLMLFLPGGADGDMLLTSNTVEFDVLPPDMKTAGDGVRDAFAAELVRAFRANEYQGQRAHAAALKAGPSIVPELVKALAAKDAKPHTRMWIATALADLRDDRAAAELICLLDDSQAGVRYVVAYHGPKMNNAQLDKAIVEAAASGTDAGMTAWALVGFLNFQKNVQERLVTAGLDSADPKARAAAAKALGGLASEFNKSRLRELARDKDATVRLAAQRVLKAMGVKESGNE